VAHYEQQRNLDWDSGTMENGENAQDGARDSDSSASNSISDETSGMEGSKHTRPCNAATCIIHPVSFDWYNEMHEEGMKDASLQLPFVPITINDEHNDVLFFWTLFNVSNMPVLHIDSHSDAFLPQKDDCCIPMHDQLRHMSKADFMKVILRETNIGDYLPVAQYFGMVGPKVIWISSAWDNVRDYNLLHGVQYHATLGRQTNGAFCQCCSTESKPTDGHSLGDLVSAQACDESDLQWKTSIQWDVTDIQHAKETILNTWGVPQDVSAEEEAPREDVSSERTTKSPKKQILQTPYIIDLDLDYFAASEPTIYQFISNIHPLADILYILKLAFSKQYFCAHPEEHLSGAGREREELISEWVNELINPLFANYDMSITTDQDAPTLSLQYDPHKDGKILSLMCPHIDRDVFSAALQRGNSSAGQQKVSTDEPTSNLGDPGAATPADNPPTSSHYDNNPSHAHYQHIINIKSILLHFYSRANYLQLYLLFRHQRFFAFNCETNFLFGVCSSGDPSYFASPSHITRRIEQIVQLIKEVGRDPYLISIARSLDGYVPKHLHAFIETKLLEALSEGVFDKPTKVYFKPHMTPGPISSDKAQASEETVLSSSSWKVDDSQLASETHSIVQLLNNPLEVQTQIQEMVQKHKIIQLMHKIQKKNRLEIDGFVRSFGKFLEIKKKYWEREGFKWNEGLHETMDSAAKGTIEDIKHRTQIAHERNNHIDFDAVVEQYTKANQR